MLVTPKEAAKRVCPQAINERITHSCRNTRCMWWMWYDSECEVSTHFGPTSSDPPPGKGWKPISQIHGRDGRLQEIKWKRKRAKRRGYCAMCRYDIKEA